MMINEVQRTGALRRRRPVCSFLAAAVVILAVSCPGCLDVKDHLTINPDGSGDIVLEVPQPGPEFAQLQAYLEEGGHSNIIYPPVGQQQIYRMFPAPDFSYNMKVGKTADGKPTNLAEVKFKDVSKLLAGPYAKAHSLIIAVQGDQLVLSAKTGLQYIGRLDPLPTLPPEANMPISVDDIKAGLAKTRCEFRVTLPGAVTASGAVVDGRTATWTVDRTKLADAAAATAAFDAVLSAQCPAAGVTFKPIVPPRLDRAAFKDLKEESLGQADAVDVDKIRAATKFIPIMLRITRSFNLSGDAFNGENAAVFTGAVILPRAFKPQRWGDVKIDEAKDNLGQSLILPAKEGNGSNWRQQQTQNMMEMAENNANLAAASGPKHKKLAPDPNLTHLLVVPLAPPSPNANELTSLKASLDLIYPGATQIVRLENVVPEAAIRDMNKNQTSLSGNLDRESVKLKALDLTLNLNRAERMGCMTMLQFSTEGQGAVKDLQVFDAQGVPLVTLFNHVELGGASPNKFEAMVLGAAQGPLSLALVVEGGGPTVTVPLAVTNVSLRGDETKPAAPPAADQKKPESEKSE
jgi:hypothetical protein